MKIRASTLGGNDCILKVIRKNTIATFFEGEKIKFTFLIFSVKQFYVD